MKEVLLLITVVSCLLAGPCEDHAEMSNFIITMRMQGAEPEDVKLETWKKFDFAYAAADYVIECAFTLHVPYDKNEKQKLIDFFTESAMFDCQENYTGEW